MSTGTVSPFRSGQRPGRDDFPHLLRAEWTKFRSVRGWVIAMAAAAVLTALATVALAGSAGGKQNPGAHPAVAIGPGGEAVTDDFYLVRQPMEDTGSITVRVTSLADDVVPGESRPTKFHAVQPWAKAGIIIKAGTRPGSAYAAIMVTPGHGVRMQYDFTHDTAGLAGPASAASPRWLRLARSGDTVTGYDSADGTHWTEIGTARLAGLPPVAQTGLFVASPQYLLTVQQFANNNNEIFDTQATAAFDHVRLAGGQPGHAWRSGTIGFTTGPPNPGGGDISQCGPSGQDCAKIGSPPAARFSQAAGRFTLSGSGGDIAPYVTNVDPLGLVLKGSLIGLIAVIVLGAMFITAEYRRGLIRTTFSASPRRGRVLAAKAVVIGMATFVSGLAGAVIAVPIAERKLHAGGWISSVYPIWSLTSGHGLQIVLGTAALLAAGAILALSAGAVLRSSAGAITAAVVMLIVPLLLAVVLPQGPGSWLLRLTPAAAFGLQQGTTRSPQVMSFCQPYNGCFPLAPWYGFAVLCVWAAAALALATYLLRRRDA